MQSFLISLISVYSYCILIIISSLLEISNGVPDDYCLAPLNKSDCGKPVTAVFTYWLPGSRCEIEFWRGCPTTNKFPNQYVCSHYCIGALLKAQLVDYDDIGPLKKKTTDNICDEEFNSDDCEGEPTEVYTYNKTSGMCVPVTWRGCESVNRFADEEDCTEACQSNVIAVLKKLSGDELEVMDQMLNNTEQLLSNASEEDSSSEETTTAEIIPDETTKSSGGEETTEDEDTNVSETLTT